MTVEELIQKDLQQCILVLKCFITLVLLLFFCMYRQNTGHI